MSKPVFRSGRFYLFEKVAAVKRHMPAASPLIHSGPAGVVREERGTGVDHMVRLNSFDV